MWDDERDIRTDGSYVFDDDDIAANRIWAILAYFVFFLPLLVARESHYARFHANQSLLTWLAMIICGIIGAVVPVIGFVVGGVLGVWLGLYPWFTCLVMAVKGGVRRAPYYGQFNLISL